VAKAAPLFIYLFVEALRKGDEKARENGPQKAHTFEGGGIS